MTADLADRVAAAKAGDRSAFDDLVRATYADAYTLAYRLVGNEEDARDVVQDAYLRAYKSLKKFREDAAFSTWLYRIVANCCTDKQRRRRRFVPFSPQLEFKAMTTGGGQENAYQRRQLAASVRAAISELSPKLRLPILLRYVEEMSYEEMASALNCSKGTIASRLNRGHKILARRLAHLRGALCE
jgi:RNA polymerase sigma-70 factor (ECF subfamily)